MTPLATAHAAFLAASAGHKAAWDAHAAARGGPDEARLRGALDAARSRVARAETAWIAAVDGLRQELRRAR
jgi:hypothetical protein